MHSLTFDISASSYETSSDASRIDAAFDDFGSAFFSTTSENSPKRCTMKENSGQHTRTFQVLLRGGLLVGGGDLLHVEDALLHDVLAANALQRLLERVAGRT